MATPRGTTYRLTERAIAKRLGLLHEAAEFWGWERLDASVTGDLRWEQEAHLRQRALLEQAAPLRKMLADVRGAR